MALNCLLKLFWLLRRAYYTTQLTTVLVTLLVLPVSLHSVKLVSIEWDCTDAERFSVSKLSYFLSSAHPSSSANSVN
eukprot:6204775-Pleurochrysis_carterae.AAC.2